MADDTLPDPTTAPNLRDQAGQQMLGALETLGLLKQGDAVETGVYNIVTNIIGFILQNAAKFGATLGQIIADAENKAGPEFAQLASVAVADLFGVNIPINPGAGGRGGRTAAANAVGEMLFNAFSGAAQGGARPGGELVPSDVPAKNFLATMTQLSLEGWLEGWLVEALSLGQLETFGELDDKISHTLGLGRAAASVHGPLVKHLVVTPLDWKLSKEHRPTLLSASALAKQIARNPAKRETWLEDLRRQGYSEERIDALLNEQAKFHSVADLDLLLRAGQWDTGRALKHLQDQGYASDIADTELQIERLKRIATFERAMASAGVDGFVAGRIDEGTLGGFITGVTISAQEKAQYQELAAARRICARQPLTPAEAKAAVHAGILAPSDYRRALERDGRSDEAVVVLELLLRKELAKEADIEQLKEEQAAERAAEKAKRDADALARKAAADAKLALARRGSMADLEAAYIHGLIELGRVREVYAATYDADTVGVLVALLEDRRVAYVAQQEAAAAARARAATRGINVGELETAVLTGVLTLDQFRRQLDNLNFDGDDADLLTATLAAKLQQRADAEHARDAAAAAAKIRHVDLATFELLVRRGHRTLADYGALLHTLHFEDGAIAALTERLQLLIDDDAAAARVRADAAAKLRAKGLSLDQIRRAVILGIVSIDTFAPFLLDHGFSAPAIAVLVAELQIDADEAAAARRRRQEADRRTQAGKAPLSDVRRAARLGLIPVDVYIGRLRADGYTDEDIAIERDLLAAEMGDDAARRTAAAAAETAAADQGLTLAQLAAAVKANATTIDVYHARALALGLAPADAAILTATLQDEIDVTSAARQRRRVLADAGGDRELARADVEKAVRKGVSTIADYSAWLSTAGYTDDDAALLVAVLEADLAGAGGGNTGGGA